MLTTSDNTDYATSSTGQAASIPSAADKVVVRSPRPPDFTPDDVLAAHRGGKMSVSLRAPLANRRDYGLLAGIWTTNNNKALQLASKIKAGQVYVNTYGAGGGVELPFGGYKKSGYGREKGLESLASYTQVKNVCVKFA